MAVPGRASASRPTTPCGSCSAGSHSSRRISRPCRCCCPYWMMGAFFMATKRLAEYRHIADPGRRRRVSPFLSPLHRRAAAAESRVLRDGVGTVCRHLHRPVPSRADPVRAARRGRVHVLSPDRAAARTARHKIPEKLYTGARVHGVPGRELSGRSSCSCSRASLCSTRCSTWSVRERQPALDTRGARCQAMKGHSLHVLVDDRRSRRRVRPAHDRVVRLRALSQRCGLRSCGALPGPCRVSASWSRCRCSSGGRCAGLARGSSAAVA